MPSGPDHHAHVATLAAELGRMLDEQRGRVQHAVEQQRERLRALEGTLEARFQKVREALVQAQGEYQQRDTTHASRVAELKREEERLLLRNSELSKQRGQLEALVSHLEQTQQSASAQQLSLLEEVARQMADLRQRELQISKSRNDMLLAQREVESARRIYEERERVLRELEQELLDKEEALRLQEGTLAEQQRDLVARSERTRRQRTTIARDLRKQRRELESLRQRQLSELAEYGEGDAAAANGSGKDILARELAAAREQLHELRGQLYASRDEGHAEHDRLDHDLRNREHELSRLSDQLQLREQELRKKRSQLALEFRARRKELLAELEQRQAEIEKAAYESKSSLAMKMAETQAQHMIAHEQAEKERSLRATVEAQLKHVAEELEYYQQRVKELEAFEPATDSTCPSADLADLQQRLEMTLADLKAERARNEELSAQVRKAAAVAAPAAAANTNALDWEARKRSLLAQLESDYADAGPAEQNTRLTIEATIRQTDETIAAKDEEIARLQAQLEQQALSASWPDPEQIRQALDADEIVVQEREKLRLLQEQLREQFRQAEIDLSVERARLGRERLEIEELQRRFASRSHPADTKDSGTDPLKKQQASLGGRWLARLGLSETDDK